MELNHHDNTDMKGLLITVFCFIAGKILGVVDATLINPNIMQIMQFTAFGISISVGIITIYQKLKKKK
jgi:hypothetical protein